MRALANAGLALLSLILVLCALEVGFRLFAPQRSEVGSLFEPDAELGWSMVPDHEATVVYKGAAWQRIRTNAAGFRDADFASIAPDRRRIAVLGDSFVANLAVGDDEVFTEVMERRLPGVAVMNLGVNGYGQVQQLLLLDRVLRDLEPDLVLAVVYVRNDFTDNTGVAWSPGMTRPAAALQGERLIVLPPPRQPARRPAQREPGVLGRLHLATFVRTRLAFYRARAAAERAQADGVFRPSRATPPELYLAARAPSEETRRLYRLMEMLLAEMAARGRAHQVPVAFVLAPSLVQASSERWERVLASHDADASGFDPALPGRRLAAWAGAGGLPLLDLLPALQTAEASGVPAYHEVQQHWTPEGNRVVAEALLDFEPVRSLAR